MNNTEIDAACESAADQLARVCGVTVEIARVALERAAEAEGQRILHGEDGETPRGLLR